VETFSVKTKQNPPAGGPEALKAWSYIIRILSNVKPLLPIFNKIDKYI